jgi:acetyl esterase/lipase
MASWQARVARYIVRKRVRPALGDMRDLLHARKVFGQALPPPKGVRYTRDTLGGVPGEWVESERAADIATSPRPTLMYIHGGGFIGGSPLTHRPITAAFALQGLRVFAPDYRLAPEHPFPAPLDDVLAAWHALRMQHAADSPGQRLAAASAWRWPATAPAAILRSR